MTTGDLHEHQNMRDGLIRSMEILAREMEYFSFGQHVEISPREVAVLRSCHLESNLHVMPCLMDSD